MGSPPPEWFCLDCGVDTYHLGEYYMVNCWPKDLRGMLCVGCLENRIGRKLFPPDFEYLPCNFIFTKSRRLLSRQFPDLEAMLAAGFEGWGAILPDGWPPRKAR